MRSGNTLRVPKGFNQIREACLIVFTIHLAAGPAAAAALNAN